MQQIMESILPFITMSNNAKLESRAVEQHKIHGSDRVDLLHFVAEFNILSDGTVEVDHSGTVVAPALEEGVFLSFPDHLEPLYMYVSILNSNYTHRKHHR